MELRFPRYSSDRSIPIGIWTMRAPCWLCESKIVEIVREFLNGEDRIRMIKPGGGGNWPETRISNHLISTSHWIRLSIVGKEESFINIKTQFPDVNSLCTFFAFSLATLSIHSFSSIYTQFNYYRWSPPPLSCWKGLKVTSSISSNLDQSVYCSHFIRYRFLSPPSILYFSIFKYRIQILACITIQYESSTYTKLFAHLGNRPFNLIWSSDHFQ